MLPAKPKAKADNTYPDLQLIQFWTSHKPNLIFVLLYIVLKKITTNTPSSHRVWHCSWKSCTVHATYRLVTNLHADNKLICRLSNEKTDMSKMYNNQVQQADNGKYPIGSTMFKFNRQRKGWGWSRHWRTYPSPGYVTCGFSLFLVITLGPRGSSPS